VTPFLAVLRVELLLAARRGETLLLTIGIPVGLLVFFSTVDVLPLPEGADEAVDFLAPGVLALAVMSTGLVQTAIGVAFERQYGVLRRLAITPLGTGRLVAAKITAVAVIEVAQIGVLVAVALALGWSPELSPGALAALVGGLLAGTAAFGGLGLLLAANLRGEATIAVANGLYLVLLLLGGMAFPVDELPSAVQAVAEALPAAALADVLRTATSGGSADLQAWLVLGAWAVAAPVAAARSFGWGTLRR
jgi:ABC-2 type transport system permease protein